jgi:hypothetical protein
MSDKDSSTSARHHFLIRDLGMETIKKNRRILCITEEKSGVCLYKAKIQTQFGASELILQGSANK